MNTRGKERGGFYRPSTFPATDRQPLRFDNSLLKIVSHNHTCRTATTKGRACLAEYDEMSSRVYCQLSSIDLWCSCPPHIEMSRNTAISFTDYKIVTSANHRRVLQTVSSSFISVIKWSITFLWSVFWISVAGYWFYLRKNNNENFLGIWIINILKMTMVYFPQSRRQRI